MSFDITNFQSFLKDKYFRENYDAFNLKLIESEGVIAGSSVLSVYQSFRNGADDLDIYNHISKAKILVDFLKSIGWKILKYSNYITPEYDESFFKKNHILGRFRLTSKTYDHIDILIVDDEYSLESIVQNFDLSVCEIWYDGNKIQASDEDGIRDKVATLRKEYISALLQRNRFTVDRIVKYNNRGFKIKVNNDCIENAIYLEKPHKTVSNPEEWTVLKVYKNLLFNIDDKNLYANMSPTVLDDIDFFNNFMNDFVNVTFNLFVKYPLTNFTVENLNKITEQLLGIDNLSEEEKKRICKKFYIKLLAKDYNYKYFPRKYKKYIKDYLNIKDSDIRVSEYYDEDEDFEDEEDDDDENDEEDDEDENQNTEEDNTIINRNLDANMVRIREIREVEEEREREREREWRERDRERREMDRERAQEITIRTGLLREVQNYPEDEPIFLEILSEPNLYSTDEIRRILFEHYKSQINRLIEENNLNISEEFIQENSNNISGLKGLLNYYHQRKYYFEKIEQIIRELREHNPRNLEISDFENLITTNGERSENLKESIERYYEYQNFDSIGNLEENLVDTPIEFEGIDFDESRLGNTCQDLIMFDEKEITEYLHEEGAVILINRGSGNDSDILCFDRETLQQLFNDKDDGWFYACTGNLMWKSKAGNRYRVQELSNDRSISNHEGLLQILRKPYVKIPINAEGMNAFISARELYSIIQSDNNVFYIEPKLDAGGNQISFTHTITHGVSQGGSFVSANHCQSGSNILLYEVKVCNNPELCIRSILQ